MKKRPSGFWLVLLFVFLQMMLMTWGEARPPARANRVDITDDRFSPATLTVRTGEKVTWTNRGKKDHTVTNKRLFDSGPLAPGKTFSYQFNKPGTYHYICSFHSFLMFGMQGTVLVK